MYSQIAANKRKTVFIMLFFVIIISLLGYVYGLYVGDMTSVYIVFAFAIIYTLISYFASSKVALAVNGAKEIGKKDNPRLYRIVENLCITTGMPMPKVYIINDPAPNAFATGRNPQHASVAATTGLLDIMDDSELEGVMAHEIGHIQNYDIRVMMTVFACVSVIGLLSDFMMRMFWFGDNRRDNNNPYILILALVMAVLAPIVATLVQLAVSRRREFLADATGALTTRYPEGLASALKKIEQAGSTMRRQSSSTAHLFFANPLKGKSMAKLFSTHPPVEERVAKLEIMGTEL